MADLRFDGRVAIVTGAGAGLGRAYALLLGQRGAKVVVNDLGGGRDGGGATSSSAADGVVNEIRANGGTAVADYNSVVNGEKIVKTALDHFGRVDILINNAGILRDRTIPKMSEQDWDLVHNVHLKGSFKTTQAAFPIMKKQGYGRIVMTTSNSGLYGNYGQANYSSAKSGLVGLSSTVAIEGAKTNVFCNVIVPTAASRLTEDILPPDIYDALKPELIAPVVTFLCHELCRDNGTVIEAAAGWAGKTYMVRSPGALLRINLTDAVTVENVRDKWPQITDMTHAQHFDSIHNVTGELINSLEATRTGGGGGSDDISDSYSFGQNDVILYNLGVGCTLRNPDDLKFLYESHEDFAAVPAFYTLPALQAVFRTADFAKYLPGKDLHAGQQLHAEQYVEFVGPIPKEGTLVTRAKVVEVLDKGSGAVFVNDVETFNEQGQLIIRNQIVSFAVGSGNFGGPRSGKYLIPIKPKPNRAAPDAHRTYKTNTDQAALYRLSGDPNPLHIDPNMAQAFGYAKPILHGLCSYGISIKLVLEAYGNNDPGNFKACKARFTKPVIPGQTLRVDMWRDQNRIHFESVVQETGTVVISGAYVDLISVKMVPSPQTNNVLAPGQSGSLQSDAIFEYIIEQIESDPKKATQIGGLFLYNITKNGKQVKQWTMDLKNAKVYEGAPKEGKPVTTFTVSDTDFVDMSTGKLQPQAAFMKGKLKVTGNIMMAQKLGNILKTQPKL